MSVVRTGTRPGKPTSAGTSNASMARMNTNIANASMEGSDSRKVTRWMVAHNPAPLTRAASSSSGLALRKVAPTSRKANGDHRKPSTAIIPGME
jgi:hypothetical protein